MRRAAGDFAVGLDPERTVGADREGNASFFCDAAEAGGAAVLGVGEDTEEIRAGDVGSGAEVDPAVVSAGVRAEAEAAALVLVVHAGCK